MIIEMLQMGMPLTKVNDNSMEAIAIAVVIHCRLLQQVELVYRKINIERGVFIKANCFSCDCH